MGGGGGYAMEGYLEEQGLIDSHEDKEEVGIVIRKKLGDLYNVVVLPLPPWMFSDFNSMWYSPLPLHSTAE